MLRFISLLTVFVMVSSCVKHSDKVAKLHEDPMMHVFESIREDIQGLSDIGRFELWLAGCDSHFEIQDIEDLNRAVKYFGEVPRSEMDELKNQLKKSDNMHFFGFECDNSVIAGFEEYGEQKFIYPSNYKPN